MATVMGMLMGWATVRVMVMVMVLERLIPFRHLTQPSSWLA